MKKLLTITLALLSLLVITSCGTKTVKVQKYIEVEYSPAYNGYAEPTLKINEEELNQFIDVKKVEKLFEKAIKQNKEAFGDYEEMMEDFDMEIGDIFEMFGEEVTRFTDYFDIEFAERYENLSNGDKITVNVTPNRDMAMSFGMSTEKFVKALGIKLSKEQIEIKVKGLEKLKVAELDLDEMVKVDFGKYNGYSTPAASIDTTYLRKITIPEFVKDYANRKFGYTRDIISEDYEWFDVKFDKAYSNIKNGDKITVRVVLNDELADDGITLEELETELGIKLKKNSKTFKVSGLEKPKNVIDIFKDVDQFLIYTGGNGHGNLKEIFIPDDYTSNIGDLYFSKGNYDDTLKVIHNNSRIADIDFSFKASKNLTKGDTVEISADFDAEPFENLGYIVPSDKTNIEVPDLGVYLTSKKQLTPAVVEAIKEKIIEYRSPKEIYEIYYATCKPGVECNYVSTSIIVPVVYKGGWFGGFYIDTIYNLVIKPEGGIKVGYDTSYSNYSTLEIAQEHLNTKEYDFELIYSSADEAEESEETEEAAA